HWEFDFRSVVSGEALEQSLCLTLDQCTLNVLRDEHYKYVHFVNLPPLFFDLKADPGEFINQAQNPKYQPLVLEYAQKMLSWRMNHDEQTLTHLALTEEGVISRDP
ncbi:MAG: sulfatase, partial [Gammaproteobacteria bacterium]|nr:sulfatase [Gammaproteobacteria bacterium]